MEWINVKHRKPLYARAVIVSSEDGVSVGYFKRGIWRECFNHNMIIVTHWMPFPNPPEEISNGESE